MSATRNAAKPAARTADALQTFTWTGKDKRGVVMKGEQAARNINFVKAELRRQGITPQTVKAKGKPLFGASGAVSGILGAYVVLFPKSRVWILLFLRLPLRIGAVWVQRAAPPPPPCPDRDAGEGHRPRWHWVRCRRLRSTR